MTPEEWSAKYNRMWRSHWTRVEAHERLRGDVEFPSIEQLRPATPSDVTVGAIIYYIMNDGLAYWQEVERVITRNSKYTKYVSSSNMVNDLKNGWVRND